MATDRSVHNRDKDKLPQTLGYGAGAAVLIPLEADKNVIVTVENVGTATDNVECEVTGVMIALNTVEKYTVGSNYGVTDLEAFILTDCVAAIDVVCDQTQPEKRSDTFKEIWRCLEILEQRKITVKMVWCPGHCGIEYNDIADKEAKKCASNLSKNRHIQSELKEVSYNTISKLIREQSIQQWQTAWERGISGQKTRDLIPSVRTRIKWPKFRNADISYARMILNSTNLNHDMHKMKLAESPNCECNQDRETVEHHVLHCKDHRKERSEMMNELQRIWMQNRKSGCLNVSIEMLLGPKFSDKLTKEEDDAVKNALFVFLMSTEKKI